MSRDSPNSPSEAEPLGRCLRLLGILQARSSVSAGSLAATLGVTPRTVRRDVVRLRELGYRIQSLPGQGGGYVMRSGPRTPMLVLEADEAEAVALSLAQAADAGISGLEEPALTALSKIRRTMSPQVAARAERIHQSTAVVSGHPGQAPFALVAQLAEAASSRFTVRFTHQRGRGPASRTGTGPAAGSPRSERRVDPYRVVTFAQRWYLFGWCHLRQDWRTFRVDRISDLHVTTFTFSVRQGPDPADAVRHAVLQAPYDVLVRVIAEAAPAVISEHMPRNAADLQGWPEGEADPSATLITTGAEGLSYLALHLALLGVPMRVVDPPELVEKLHRLGKRLLETRYVPEGAE